MSGISNMKITQTKHFAKQDILEAIENAIEAVKVRKHNFDDNQNDEQEISSCQIMLEVAKEGIEKNIE